MDTAEVVIFNDYFASVGFNAIGISPTIPTNNEDAT
jgi:hypothetical protein